MKVLMQNRLGPSSHIGGDLVQMTSTKAALEKMGFEVDIGLKNHGRIDDYDIVHLFNLVTLETQVSWSSASEKRVPIVISPIYWPMEEYYAKGFAPTGVKTMDKIIRGFCRFDSVSTFIQAMMERPATDELRKASKDRVRTGKKNIWSRILESAELLLPNSLMEARILMDEFNVPDEKISVVPNAPSDIFFESTSAKVSIPFLEGEYVLSVARIEGRKNTLELIRACNVIGVPLVLVGPTTGVFYNESCRKEARKGRVCFYGPMHPESPELVAVYRGAMAHALVSWYETPGISSLEAAACGIRIVSTKKGCAEEYFGDLAYYVDPGDFDSICQALERCIKDNASQKQPVGLKDLVRSRYRWSRVAELTVKCYERVLDH